MLSASTFTGSAPPEIASVAGPGAAGFPAGCSSVAAREPPAAPSASATAAIAAPRIMAARGLRPVALTSKGDRQEPGGLLHLEFRRLAQLDPHLGAGGGSDGDDPLDGSAEDPRVEGAAVVGDRDGRGFEVQEDLAIAPGDAVLDGAIAAPENPSLALRPEADPADRRDLPRVACPALRRGDRGDGLRGRVGRRFGHARIGGRGLRRLGGRGGRIRGWRAVAPDRHGGKGGALLALARRCRGRLVRGGKTGRRPGGGRRGPDPGNPRGWGGREPGNR